MEMKRVPLAESAFDKLLNSNNDMNSILPSTLKSDNIFKFNASSDSSDDFQSPKPISKDSMYLFQTPPLDNTGPSSDEEVLFYNIGFKSPLSTKAVKKLMSKPLKSKITLKKKASTVAVKQNTDIAVTKSKKLSKIAIKKKKIEAKRPNVYHEPSVVDWSLLEKQDTPVQTKKPQVVLNDSDEIRQAIRAVYVESPLDSQTGNLLQLSDVNTVPNSKIFGDNSSVSSDIDNITVLGKNKNTSSRCSDSSISPFSVRGDGLTSTPIVQTETVICNIPKSGFSFPRIKTADSVIKDYSYIRKKIDHITKRKKTNLQRVPRKVSAWEGSSPEHIANPGLSNSGNWRNNFGSNRSKVVFADSIRNLNITVSPRPNLSIQTSHFPERSVCAKNGVENLSESLNNLTVHDEDSSSLGENRGTFITVRKRKHSQVLLNKLSESSSLQNSNVNDCSTHMKQHRATNVGKRKSESILSKLNLRLTVTPSILRNVLSNNTRKASSESLRGIETNPCEDNLENELFSSSSDDNDAFYVPLSQQANTAGALISLQSRKNPSRNNSVELFPCTSPEIGSFSGGNENVSRINSSTATNNSSDHVHNEFSESNVFIPKNCSTSSTRERGLFLSSTDENSTASVTNLPQVKTTSSLNSLQSRKKSNPSHNNTSELFPCTNPAIGEIPIRNENASEIISPKDVNNYPEYVDEFFESNALIPKKRCTSSTSSDSINSHPPNHSERASFQSQDSQVQVISDEIQSLIASKFPRVLLTRIDSKQLESRSSGSLLKSCASLLTGKKKTNGAVEEFNTLSKKKLVQMSMDSFLSSRISISSSTSTSFNGFSDSELSPLVSPFSSPVTPKSGNRKRLSSGSPSSKCTDDSDSTQSNISASTSASTSSETSAVNNHTVVKAIRKIPALALSRKQSKDSNKTAVCKDSTLLNCESEVLPVSGCSAVLEDNENDPVNSFFNGKIQRSLVQKDLFGFGIHKKSTTGTDLIRKCPLTCSEFDLQNKNMEKSKRITESVKKRSNNVELKGPISHQQDLSCFFKSVQMSVGNDERRRSSSAGNSLRSDTEKRAHNMIRYFLDLSSCDGSFSVLSPKRRPRQQSLCKKPSLDDNAELHRLIVNKQPQVLLEQLDESIARAAQLGPLDDRSKVMCLCGQDSPLTFRSVIPDRAMRTAKKIGEGSYGEVFSMDQVDVGRVAVKIVPIEGNLLVNGAPQKMFKEILSEVILSKHLNHLSQGKKYKTPGFIHVHRISCIKGLYPKKLLKEWTTFDKKFRSQNDNPVTFSSKQLYIMFQFSFGGKDLEAYQPANPEEAMSIVSQVACSLAVAEKALEFEHRDLHWGNVLVDSTAHTSVEFVLGNRSIVHHTHGITTSIIDFTLSRLKIDGASVFCNLSEDPDIFKGSGDIQFDVYRKMKEHTKEAWAEFHPFTNILWLEYLTKKILEKMKSPNRSQNKSITVLQKWKKGLSKYRSAESFVLSEIVNLSMCVKTKFS